MSTPSFNEIIPGLFLGPEYVLEKEWKGNLEDKNVLRVLRCLVKYEAPPKRSDGVPVELMHLSIVDEESAQIDHHFDRAANFIHEILSDRNAKKDAKGRPASVYVHCAAGVSRSATMVCAYLIIHHGMTVAQALRHTSSKRNQIEPNVGFLRQLLGLEQLCASQREDASETPYAPSVSIDEYCLLNYHRALGTSLNRAGALVAKIRNKPDEIQSPLARFHELSQKSKSQEELVAGAADILPPKEAVEKKFGHLLPADTSSALLLQTPEYGSPDTTETALSSDQRLTLRMLRLAAFEDIYNERTSVSEALMKSLFGAN